MGSVLIPDSKEKKENIYFVFESERYNTYEEFAEGVEIGGVKLFNADTVIEILRAGIIDGEPMIKTPWGDTRLAKLAIQNFKRDQIKAEAADLKNLVNTEEKVSYVRIQGIWFGIS